MIVVADSSPLIAFARIGMLDLLPQIFSTIHVPEAVWLEVADLEGEKSGVQQIRSAQWIQRHLVDDVSLVSVLRQELDAGEAETIALSMQIHAELTLMDEQLGREVAQMLKCRIMGAVGILCIAKRTGKIRDIKTHLDDLRDKAGFWIGDSLYRRVLTDSGE